MFWTDLIWMANNENASSSTRSHGFYNPSTSHSMMCSRKFTVFWRYHESFRHKIKVFGAFGMLESFYVLIQSIFTSQLITSWKMVDSLVWQHGFKRVWFWMNLWKNDQNWKILKNPIMQTVFYCLDFVHAFKRRNFKYLFHLENFEKTELLRNCNFDISKLGICTLWHWSKHGQNSRILEFIKFNIFHPQIGSKNWNFRNSNT